MGYIQGDNMDAYSSAMMSASIGQGIGSIASAYASVSAINSQIKYQRQVFEYNQKIAKMQEEDAYRRGETALFNYAQKAQGVFGSTRTAYAGQNVNVHKGSARRVLESNQDQAAQDMLTIKSNTVREAYGIRSESLNVSTQNIMNQIELRGQRASTIATAGSNIVNSGALAYAYSKR